jgi:hypothetical protein
LKVPLSKNPKALALCLSAYCDLTVQGINCRDQAIRLKEELKQLKSPGYGHVLCWGYDWDFVSFRGTVLPKFHPNSVATCFVANALLDMAEVFKDAEAHSMALSAGDFITRHLNRSVSTSDAVCFSYSPADKTRIYNSSVMAGALLARLGGVCGQPDYLDLARRSMAFVTGQQGEDGSWPYGQGRMQRWIDGFHTGYNLCALVQYRKTTGDASFDSHLERGYEFYKRMLIGNGGVPKSRHDRVFPIDIHACSQAILTFCAFRNSDVQALGEARKTADWTISNMCNDDGTFSYQRHRWWRNRTPYMRWGQAWMFRALTRLYCVQPESASRATDVRRRLGM